MQALIARGVSAQLDSSLIYIGNRRLMEEVTNASVPDDIEQQMKNLETQGHTAMIVLKEQTIPWYHCHYGCSAKRSQKHFGTLKKK